ncbi:MAG TPA: hypothetical protein VF017_18710 [Thermoanaerobaculia bacterium]|nr:hypothetical protein [Thermoanaerobaculia bacterium]
MIRDAIITEVRAVREQMAEECGYDVHALFENFRRLEATSTTPHVSFISHPAEPAAARQAEAADRPTAGR